MTILEVYMSVKLHEKMECAGKCQREHSYLLIFTFYMSEHIWKD